jgi:hypothetical protein
MRWFESILVCTFALLFCISLVSARTCNHDYYVMFKSSGSSNAHAGLWNSSYDEEVCFEDFFNVTGVSGESDFKTKLGTEDIRTGRGDGENIILRLYREFNSHVNIPNGTSYNTTAAYGDLHCVAESSLYYCPSFCLENGHCGKRIIFLSREYNAHISRPPSDYALEICCASEYFDPLPSEGVCGNDVIEGDEVCDGTAVGSATCPHETPFGAPTCSGDCKRITYENCRAESEITGFCKKYGFQGGGTEHKIKFGTNVLPVGPTMCDDYNDIKLSQVPTNYTDEGGNLTDYKAEMCNSCSVMINLKDLLPLDGYDPRCSWNGTRCNLEYRSAGGDICIRREVEGSDPGCQAGQSVKTVNMTDTCDSARCGIPSGCPTQVRCPTGVVQLPFFDYKNLIAAIIVIGMIYLVYKFKRK